LYSPPCHLVVVKFPVDELLDRVVVAFELDQLQLAQRRQEMIFQQRFVETLGRGFDVFEILFFVLRHAVLEPERKGELVLCARSVLDKQFQLLSSLAFVDLAGIPQKDRRDLGGKFPPVLVDSVNAKAAVEVDGPISALPPLNPS